MTKDKDSGDKRTSIQIYGSTKNQLDNLGTKGDTYDDIIRRLLNIKVADYRKELKKYTSSS